MNTTVMPDLSTPAYGFHHTLDSALDVLECLKIPFHRIDLRMEGGGYPKDIIVSQSPSAGAPLTKDVRVSLGVAGNSTFYTLPVGMWDSSSESEPSLADIVDIFDDPIEKAASWVRKSSRLFDIGPDNPIACERWIRLFGIGPEDWPRPLHHRLSLLLPSIHRLAGTKNGIRFCFSFLLDLPIQSIHQRPVYLSLAADECSRVGSSRDRAAINFLIGRQIEGWRELILVLGPVPLPTLMDFRDPARLRLLSSVAELCLPCYQSYRLEWRALDDRFPIRLGYAHQNGLLGINSHMGAVPYDNAFLMP